MHIQSKCNLLPLLMDSIVISHVFPHLLATNPSKAHMANKQGMVYGYCKKYLSKCIGDGESKP